MKMAKNGKTTVLYRKYRILRLSVSTFAILLAVSIAGCSPGTNSETPVSPPTINAPTTFDNATSLKAEGAGFDSPEEAVKAYLDGLKNKNLNSMISAFAIETYAKNYNFESSLNRITAYSPTYEVKLPNANDFVVAINAQNRKTDVANNILQQYLLLCYNFDLEPLKATSFQDEEDVHGFVSELSKNLNNPKFESLEVVGFIPPEALSDVYISEQNQQNLKKLANIYGADKLVSRVVVFKLDGIEYLLCFEAVDYGGKWYLYNFGGNIANLLSISPYLLGMMPNANEFVNSIGALIVK